MNTKHCVLLSGGYDSTAVLRFAPQTADLLFFDYGQLYYQQEETATAAIARHKRRRVRTIHLPLKHDAKDRNFAFLSVAAAMGYDHIWIGTRNVFPMWDKYKDSNWWTLKRFGRMLRVKVHMPVVGLTKAKITEYARWQNVPMELLFTSEGFKP